MIAKTLQDVFKRYRRPGDIVFAALFLAFAVFLWLNIDTQTQVAKRAKWFAQPALWPTIAVSGMAVFAALHFLSSALSPRIPGRWTEVSFWAMSLEYVAYFLIYVAAVPKVGYLPATVIFALFLALRTGFRNPKALGISAIFGVLVVVIFRGFLQVKIPAGELYQHLPDSIRVFALTYL